MERVVEGEVIELWQRPLGRLRLIGLSVIGFGVLYAVPAWFIPSAPPALRWLFTGGGVFIAAFGYGVLLYRRWLHRAYPRLVLGSDRLQYVRGRQPPILIEEFNYEDIVFAKVVRPGGGVAPLLGLRLIRPTLVRAGLPHSFPAVQGLGDVHGVDWLISLACCKESPEAIVERLWQRYKALGPGATRAWSEASTSGGDSQPVGDDRLQTGL